MSTLFAVRHGQASFFEANYDRLSPLGEEQSQLLGRYWADRGLRFDAVYAGPRERQIETARLVGQALTAAGLPWPDVTVTEDFDEYQAEAVLKQSLPVLIEKDERIRDLYTAVQQSANQAETLRTFQKMYEVVISRWARDELDLADIEPWSTFCARVHHGLEQIMKQAGRSQRVAVFTSGGPVGVTLQRALETSSQRTLEMAWMVRNAAYSEYLFNQEQFTLSQFNAIPHLVEERLTTYR